MTGPAKPTVPLQLRRNLEIPAPNLHAALAQLIRQTFPGETDPTAVITIRFTPGNDDEVHVEFAHGAAKPNKRGPQ